MGKSIRSKRKKRLRTLRRELVEPHYDNKDVDRFAALDAAAEAPKVELPKKQRMEVDEVSRGRSPTRIPSAEGAVHTPGVEMAAMEVDGVTAPSASKKSLKVKGGIRKRGKSKAKVNRNEKRKRQRQF